MIDVLLVRPKFDQATEISVKFSEEIKDALSHYGLSFRDLKDADAVRSTFEYDVNHYQPRMIVFYDHGNERALIDDNSKALLDFDNMQLLKDRELYTLACSFGAEGGVRAWRDGCLAVWCYVKTVGFTTDALPEFQDFFNYGLILKLHDPATSWEDIKKYTDERALTLVDKLTSENKFIAAVMMASNMDALRCYTDKTPPGPDDTKCLWRELALKLFGPRAWRWLDR